VDVTKETSLGPCFGYNKGNKEILRPQRRGVRIARGMSPFNKTRKGRRKRVTSLYGLRTSLYSLNYHPERGWAGRSFFRFGLV
jgi:hypothetical protein